MKLWWTFALLVSSLAFGEDMRFGFAEAENEQVNVQQLINLTEWVQSQPQIPILSILISRNGHVVYQLLTSSLSGEESHYLMSVTKSVTSALVGVAIDQRKLKDPEQHISELLPAQWFESESSRKMFSVLTLKDVLGMSALDAPVSPHDKSAVAQKRLIDWFDTQESRALRAWTTAFVQTWFGFSLHRHHPVARGRCHRTRDSEIASRFGKRDPVSTDGVYKPGMDA